MCLGYFASKQNGRRVIHRFSPLRHRSLLLQIWIKPSLRHHCWFVTRWLRPDQSRIYGIHLKHWQSGRIMVLFPRVIVFGPRKGPLVFSRAPLLICHVLRRLFFIPAYAHIDDLVIIEEMGDLGDQAHRILIRLHELCGWRLNGAKRVPQGPPSLTTSAELLGLDCQLVTKPHELARLSLTEAKIEKYVAQIEAAFSDGSLYPGEAAKLGGQANYSQSHVWKRSTRVLLWPIYERSKRQGASGLTKHLKWCLLGLRCIYLQRGCRVLPTLQTFAPRFEIYTDARGNLAHEWGTEQLGGLLCGPGGYEYFMVPVSQICEGTLKAGSTGLISVKPLPLS